MVTRGLLTILLPFAIFFGYVFSYHAPGLIESAFDHFIGPFMITTWIGLGFSNMWFALSEDFRKENFTPGMMAAVGLIGAGIFFIALGPGTILHEPWWFGAAVWPGIDLARPWLEKRAQAYLPEPSTPVAPAPADAPSPPAEHDP